MGRLASWSREPRLDVFEIMAVLLLDPALYPRPVTLFKVTAFWRVTYGASGRRKAVAILAKLHLVRSLSVLLHDPFPIASSEISFRFVLFIREAASHLFTVNFVRFFFLIYLCVRNFLSLSHTHTHAQTQKHSFSSSLSLILSFSFSLPLCHSLSLSLFHDHVIVSYCFFCLLWLLKWYSDTSNRTVLLPAVRKKHCRKVIISWLLSSFLRSIH